MPYEPTTNFKDSTLPVGVDLGKKLVTKDYLLEVYGTILENSPASGLVVTPELWGWGAGLDGNLGANNTTTRSTPVTTFSGGTNWKSGGAGFSYTAAIKTDGSLWIWGTGSQGNLGTNNLTQINTPVTTFAGGNDWKSVSTGARHIAAIKTDGSLWTWGRGTSGQLGNNAATDRSTPVTTFAGGNDWKQVSCGYNTTAAIKTDGSLWTWGAGFVGQLGTNDTTTRSTPVTTFAGGTNWKSVSCAGTNDGGRVAAIKTDGSLWTWGRNNFGQLGDNTTFQRNIPVTTFAGGTNWKSVAAGWEHTIAIKTDGTLWTWGKNINGQLGVNDTNGRTTPVTTFTGGTNWKSVSGGARHTTTIKTDGSLWIWGHNDFGSLGVNEGNVNKLTPVTTFAGGNNWKQVSAGGIHTVAIQSNDYI